MKITLADKFIAWLALLSGLSISAVAVYYSVAGLISIFAAAVIPIAVMGIVLELSKLVATVWLKQNWFIAPRFIKGYLLIAITILMVITSMGIFGYLSKAHMDQTLVSGDVQSKIAIYDEKIKTARENIEANRKQLKQMDEAVDQVMARSDSERGAERANAIRKSQQRDRAQLAKEIEANQKLIASLNDESAPIRAEVRKVEAEVGPIKYIAALIYGDNPDTNLLERAVRWVIIIIVIVFDPLAVILLLASQYSFQWFRKQEEEFELTPDPYVADVGEKPTEEEKEELEQEFKEVMTLEEEPKPDRNFDYPPSSDLWPFPKAEPRALDDLPDLHKIVKEGLEDSSLTIQGETEEPVDQYAYLKQDKSFWNKPEGWESVGPLVGKPEEAKPEEAKPESEADPLEQWNKMIAEAEKAVAEEQIEPGARKVVVEDGKETHLIFNGHEWVKDIRFIQSDTEESENLEGDKKFKILPELQEHLDTVEERVARGDSYIDTEGKEQPLDVDLLKRAENRIKERVDALEEESKKKSYMTKENGIQVVKTKE